MNSLIWKRLATGLVFGLTLFPALTTAVQAEVLESGTFTVTQNCPATQAISGKNPGNVNIAQRQRYEALGFNSPARKFVLIKVPNAKPERRWVSSACGTFTSSSKNKEQPKPSAVSQFSTGTNLLPFFDQLGNQILVRVRRPTSQTVDITPTPPALNQFDQAVLKTCGPIGTKLKASDFKRLMTNNPDVLQRVKQAVGGELLRGRKTDAEFLDDLTAIWSNRQGFEHVFCGELVNSTKIGGLHFAGRYLQLQQEKVGGRLANNSDREEVTPGVIYTLGVVIKKGNQTWTDAVKGYALVSNAEELLTDATKAFKAQGNVQGGCVYTVRDRETGKSFKARLFKSRDAINTFYPDATPNGNRPEDKACKA